MPRARARGAPRRRAAGVGRRRGTGVGGCRTPANRVSSSRATRSASVRLRRRSLAVVVVVVAGVVAVVVVVGAVDDVGEGRSNAAIRSRIERVRGNGTGRGDTTLAGVDGTLVVVVVDVSLIFGGGGFDVGTGGTAVVGGVDDVVIDDVVVVFVSDDSSDAGALLGSPSLLVGSLDARRSSDSFGSSLPRNELELFSLAFRKLQNIDFRFSFVVTFALL
jgi:hypothetical protein